VRSPRSSSKRVTSPRHTAALAVLVLLLALAVLAAPANAATTRAEYVAQVDPICQAADAQEAAAQRPLERASKRVLKHHRLDRKTHKKIDRLYARYLSQYAAIEHAANAQIATIPPVTEDVSLIEVWLRAREELATLQSQFSHNFVGKPGRAVTAVFRLIGLEQETHDLVRDFGFQYCSQGQIAFAVAIGGSSTLFP
jgi:hypothetical protein